MDMGVGAHVLRCPQYVYLICTLWHSLENPGCGVRVRRMWVRVVPIPPTRVHSFYLHRGDVAKL